MSAPTSRRLAAGLLAALLAGCPSKPTPVGVRPSAAASAQASAAPTSTAAPPGVTPTPAPSSLLASQAPAVAATLSGRVLAPASLVTDNGSGLVANHGAGLVSAHGAGYRALALAEQVAVAGARVQLLDAGGAPVPGPDGQPLVAVADPTGRFAFTAALPGRNLVVAVDLAAGKGQLRAIAPKGATQADADVISTLTTGYILDQYVKTQADPLATLEKLPASVEADTRSKAAAALTAVPDDLTPAKVLAAVDSLRKANKAFDDQMEVVKQLLVVGQADLGAGRPATEVPLYYVSALTLDPKGRLAITALFDGRVWALDGDGKLRTLAGSGVRGPEAAAGKLAKDAYFEQVGTSTFDAQGRLALTSIGFGNPGVFRAGLDGQVQALTTSQQPHAAALLPGDGDELLALGRDGAFALAPNQAPRKLWALPGSIKTLLRAGRDAKGRFYLQDGGNGHPAVYRVAADGTGLETLATEPAGVKGGLAVDAKGNILSANAAGDLLVTPPDGPARTLVAAFPLEDWYNLPFVLAADGSAYVGVTSKEGSLTFDGMANEVLKLADGKATPVAGAVGAVAGTAGDVALQGPRCCAFDAAGVLYVGDGARVLRIDAAGKVSYHLGPKQANATPSYEAPLTEVHALRFDAAGNLVVFDREPADGRPSGTYGRFYQLDAAGKVTLRFTAPTGQWIDHAAIASDGGLLYQVLVYPNTAYYVAPGSATAVPSGLSDAGYAMGAIGDEFALLGGGNLFRWSKAKGQHDPVALPNTYPAATEGLVCDGRGRAFLPLSYEGKLDMVDLATGARTTVAGAGTSYDLRLPMPPAFDAAGNMALPDFSAKQVLRIPAGAF